MDKKKFESLLVPPRIKFSEDESDLSKIAHVDLVMVVRCKDCGYYDEKKQICKYRPTEPLTSREPDWYCAGGVRREKNECS